MSSVKDIKSWDNNVKQYDLSKEFKDSNPFLKKFGRDHLTYTPENTNLNAIFWARYEGRMAHGYPYTAWLQLGLLYACGIYTAQEQGCIRKGVFLSRFWKFHYFDFITFLRRGAVYGWAGGLLAGTVLFGNPNLSLNRLVSSYHYYFSGEKLDNDSTDCLLLIKQN